MPDKKSQDSLFFEQTLIQMVSRANMDRITILPYFELSYYPNFSVEIYPFLKSKQNSKIMIINFSRSLYSPSFFSAYFRFETFQ